MSYPDNLSDKQFYKYKPAKVEGKAASDWLASDEGHHWQDTSFGNPYGARSNGRNRGLYSFKSAPLEGIGPARILPDDLPEHEVPAWHALRNQEVYARNISRTRAEWEYNRPLRFEGDPPERDFD